MITPVAIWVINLNPGGVLRISSNSPDRNATSRGSAISNVFVVWFSVKKRVAIHAISPTANIKPPNIGLLWLANRSPVVLVLDMPSDDAFFDIINDVEILVANEISIAAVFIKLYFF